jgi:hypothetical protein
MGLQEAIRVLPRTMPLRLGLSTSLSRVERVDAVSFLSIEAPNTKVVSATQTADYLFTKLQEQPSVPGQKTTSLEAQTRYGLTCLGGMILPNTLGEMGEVVKLAARRLLPTLETLRAIQWLKLLENKSTSPLRLTMLLEQSGEIVQPLLRVSTGNPCGGITPSLETEQSLPKGEKAPQILTLERGSRVQYRIQNWNPFPLYLVLISLESNTVCSISYATEPQPEATRQLVFKPFVLQPGATVLMPENGYPWTTGRTPGLTQTFFIATAQPLTKTLSAIRFRSTPVAAASAIALLQNPMAIVQQLFGELHQLSLPYTESVGLGTAKQWALDLRTWAMVPITYRIV